MSKILSLHKAAVWFLLFASVFMVELGLILLDLEFTIIRTFKLCYL